MSNSGLIVSNANALAVLQATTIALTFFVRKKRMICLGYRIMVFGDLLPYGTRAVSPKYTILSSGI